MATWYVDNAASGTNAGTSWTNAWESFADIAWGGVSAGDTIYISGGSSTKTYAEGLTIGASGSVGNKINIRVGQDAGHNGIVVIAPASGNGISISDRQNISISGLVGTDTKSIRITSATDAVAFAGVVGACDVGYIHIPAAGAHCVYTNAISYTNLDLEIHHIFIDNPDDSGYAMYFAQGETNEYGRVKVHHCEFYNCAGDPIQATMDSIDVYNCLFHGQLGLHDHPDGIQADANYLRVWNNEFYDATLSDGSNVSNSFIRWNPGGYSGRTHSDHFICYNNLFYNQYHTTVGNVFRGIECVPYESNAEHILIANNVFYRIPYFGLIAHLGGCTTVNDVVIANNVFIDNCDVAGANPINLIYETGYATFGGVDYGGDIIMDGNRFYDESGLYLTEDHWVINGTSRTLAQMRSIYNNAEEYGANGAPGITYADNFVPEAGDAVVDSGVNLSAFFTTDKNGVTRGDTWDVGAYEYASGETSAVTGMFAMMW